MGRPTRRTFSPQQKLDAVLALARGEKMLTELARELGVDHTTIYRWRELVQQGALGALEGKRGDPDAEARARIRGAGAGVRDRS